MLVTILATRGTPRFSGVGDIPLTADISPRERVRPPAERSLCDGAP